VKPVEDTNVGTFAGADGVVLSLLVDGGEGEKDDGPGVTRAGERGLS